MRFVPSSEQRATFVLYEINWFVSVTQMESQSFIYSPTDALVNCLKKNIKIYIQIYIKTASTCFSVTVTPSSGSALIRTYQSSGC